MKNAFSIGDDIDVVDRPIQRALISVSDKTNLEALVKGLDALGVVILSTGGTAEFIRGWGVAVTPVSDYTQFPEMMDGRVKTLHPKVHGALLGRLPMDEAAMQAHDILPLDLLVVNLYPFEQTVKNQCSYAEAIENIDIGGPAMLRSASKNHARVTTLVDPADYLAVIEELKHNQGKTSLATRQRLAGKVYAHTAQYDAQIANYLQQADVTELDSTADETHEHAGNRLLILALKAKQNLRYGENPHQQASVYTPLSEPEIGVANAALLQGKALSYNNLVDADAAVEAVFDFADTACVIVKHANPCGIAVGDTPLDAYQRAYRCDPTSAFGGIIALNRNLDEALSEVILAQQFVEVIIAPTISASALSRLSKKPNIRVLALGEDYQKPLQQQKIVRISGGYLLQDADNLQLDNENLKVVSAREPNSIELHDLLFAWRAVKHVKSNAIVFAKDRMALGIGCGQTSRVHSSLIAALKAQEQQLSLQGAVMASDAFFPFRDGLDNAAQQGITAVIQPGGSLRDKEVIAAADEYGMAMIFTGIRHFKH